MHRCLTALNDLARARHESQAVGEPQASLTLTSSIANSTMGRLSRANASGLLFSWRRHATAWSCWLHRHRAHTERPLGKHRHGSLPEDQATPECLSGWSARTAVAYQGRIIGLKRIHACLNSTKAMPLERGLPSGPSFPPASSLKIRTYEQRKATTEASVQVRKPR
jgi:hypothetical protein